MNPLASALVALCLLLGALVLARIVWFGFQVLMVFPVAALLLNLPPGRRITSDAKALDRRLVALFHPRPTGAPA